SRRRSRAAHVDQGGIRIRRRQRVRGLSQLAQLTVGAVRASDDENPEGEVPVNESEVMEKVVGILKPYVKNESALSDVTPETNILDDLEVNSARLVDVILAFEDTFGIEVADEDADTVNTVGDAV